MSAVQSVLDDLAERRLSTAPQAVGSTPRAIVVRADAITPRAVDWLWPGWLARGKLHLLAGAPGTGKTTLAIALAATVTVGGRWPDGSPSDRGSVLVWSGEDDAADVIVPRLLAAGGDRARLHVVNGVRAADGQRLPFDPARDVDLLVGAVEEIGDVRLMIVDPIVTAVAGDSHKNAEVRRGLGPLVDLAQQRQLALIGITHLSKGTSGRDPVERVTGSLAFGALARVVLLAARQEGTEDEPRPHPPRLLVRAKSNIGPDNGGFGYDLQQGELTGHPGLMTSSVLWCGRIDGTARELLAKAEPLADDVAQGDVAQFLLTLLAGREMPAKELFSAARDAGFSRDQVHRAKGRAGVTVRKGSMSGAWLWCIRDTDDGGYDASARPPAQAADDLLWDERDDLGA
jgi:putative DNA primase/helicase